MPDLTPRLSVSTPAEFEEPYFDAARSETLAWDAGVFANAENSQLQFMGGGIIGWDKDAASAVSGVLFWTEDIHVTGFTAPFEATIAGPASIELQEGEVLYFLMPRLMRSDTPVQLYRSNRIFLEGTRIHDLRFFAARSNDVLYFYNGLSLKDGDQGELFQGGLLKPSALALHTHHDPLVINPGAIGVTMIDMLMTSPDLDRVDLYRNGFLQSEPADYSLNTATGIVTLVSATTAIDERFIALRYCNDFVSTGLDHQHLAPLIIEPLPAVFVLDMLVSDPLVDGVDLFRNGQLLAEPGDYTYDSITGFVTLVAPTVASERFVALRRLKV
jgi:hypothetical protein